MCTAVHIKNIYETYCTQNVCVISPQNAIITIIKITKLLIIYTKEKNINQRIKWREKKKESKQSVLLCNLCVCVFFCACVHLNCSYLYASIIVFCRRSLPPRYDVCDVIMMVYLFILYLCVKSLKWVFLTFWHTPKKLNNNNEKRRNER